jgi:biotin carboxyl carrier protein
MAMDTTNPPTLVVDDTAYETTYTRKFAGRKRYVAPKPNEIRAFIPGIILALHVKDGDRVSRGGPLLVLEAMKMSNDMVSPRDGRIEKVHVRVGDMVAKGQLLVELAQ